MNMKKLLVTGLIASVAMASAGNSACGNGGFYVGANFGVAFSKAKATTDKYEYTANDKYYGGEDTGWTFGALQANQKLITADAASMRSETASKNMGKSSKKKTKFLAELVLGYDCRLNDVMLGIEINVGGLFGANKFKSDEIKVANANVAAHALPAGDFEQKPKEYAKVKEQWHIALMPRVGYLFTPQFEGYVTFGVKIAKYKTSVDNLMIDYTVDTANIKPEVKPMSKKSTKAVFLLGAGVRYEFNPSLFAKLEYNFEFGAKPKLHGDAMPELQKIKVTTHTVKLGLGYRF